jgi:hypothetical protein
MTVGAADLHQAVAALWVSSGVHAQFQARYRPGTVPDEYLTLHDQEALGDAVYPYCVFEQMKGKTSDVMSGSSTSVQEIRDIDWEFRIHTTHLNPKSAKMVAVELAAEIMKVFGGHPTSSPAALTLDNGKVLESMYINDYGVRTEEDEYQWVVTYTFRLDVPVEV